jgi:hypothetical protein
MKQSNADVAELADAQVSEACDGDIVEVQVLSSAPMIRASLLTGSFFIRSSPGGCLAGFPDKKLPRKAGARCFPNR